MNAITKIERKLPAITGKIVSAPLKITSKAKSELSFWKGKTESSWGAKGRLKDYWDNTSLRNWTATGTPWSAAFISYLLKGNNFKGQASHYQYTIDVLEGKNPGWEAFSIPKNKSKLKLSVGDVLVKPRSGGTYNSHGDVVVSIKNGKAYLAGGNVSNTAKIVNAIKLNMDGTIKDPQSYLVLLKKNPMSPTKYGLNKVLAYGGFAMAGVLGLTLWGKISARKNS